MAVTQQLEQIGDRFGCDQVQVGPDAEGRYVVLAGGIVVGSGWTAEAACAAAIGNAARIHLIDEDRGLVGIYSDRHAARRDRQRILDREPDRKLNVVDV